MAISGWELKVKVVKVRVGVLVAKDGNVVGLTSIEGRLSGDRSIPTACHSGVHIPGSLSETDTPSK